MSSPSSTTTFKLVLLGDGRVGKTSLVLRYVNNVFSEKQQATVQASYLTKRVVIEGVPITLAIWDTAGQERFHALGPIYYRNADAALLVYDIMDNDSFVRVRKWVKELQQMASKAIIIAIAANKSDLVRSKKFDVQEAESYAASIGAKVFVASAKSGEGIDEVFLDIATKLIKKILLIGKSNPKEQNIGFLLRTPDGCSPSFLKNTYKDTPGLLAGLLQKKKESAERTLPTPPRKGILIVDDEPEIEPQPKCCS